jgi:hypothetical protein
MEDANLLATPIKELVDEVAYADERLQRHHVNEGKRIESGLTTDLQRWMNNQDFRD